MKKYTNFDTAILEDFISFFKEKYNPSLYESNYAKFLELVNDMIDGTRSEFDGLFVGEIDEKKYEEGK